MSDSLVSIAVPTYNHEHFLGECLDSLIKQTYKNLEIIVVDDASTDLTYEVAKKYAAKYPDIIRIFKNDANFGLTQTWLRCYKEVKGEFFCTFSGDDIMMPDKIELQLKSLQENPKSTLCMTNGYWFESGSGKIIKEYTHKAKNPTYEGMLIKQMVFAPATMARSSSLPPANIFKNLLCPEWIFFTEVLSKGTCVYLDKPLIKYRVHSNSLSATTLNPKQYEATKSAFLALEYFKNNMPFHRNLYKGYARTHKRYALYLIKYEKNFLKSITQFGSFFIYILLYFKEILKSSFTKILRRQSEVR